MATPHADSTDADDKEMRREMFQQARALLEAQRLASERVRTRIASTAQQCITMAAAAVAAWGAVLSSKTPSLVFSCGLAAAAVFWIAAAIYSLRELRPRRWAVPAVSPAAFRTLIDASEKPIGRIYEQLADHLYESKMENEPHVRHLNVALDGILSLTIGGVFAGVLAMGFVRLAKPDFSGVNTLTIAVSAGCAIAVLFWRRSLFKRRLNEDDAGRSDQP